MIPMTRIDRKDKGYDGKRPHGYRDQDREYTRRSPNGLRIRQVDPNTVWPVPSMLVGRPFKEFQ